MTTPQPKPPQPARPDPGLAELFVGFLSIGVIAFGGVLPITRRAMVERYKWINEEEFIELLALSQFLPGPNITNFAVVLGSRFRGPAGSVSAVLGLTLVPAVIVIILGIVFTHYANVQALGGVVAGFAAAAAGLVISMVVRIAEPMWRHPTLRTWGIALAAFAGVALIGFPLPWVMLVLAPLSVVLAWRALP
jgi:chromate transporter